MDIFVGTVMALWFLTGARTAARLQLEPADPLTRRLWPVLYPLLLVLLGAFGPLGLVALSFLRSSK